MNFLNSMFRLGVYEIDSKNHMFYSSLAEIAQLGERQTEDLKVPGSILKSVAELWKIPGLGISFLKWFLLCFCFIFVLSFSWWRLTVQRVSFLCDCQFIMTCKFKKCPQTLWVNQLSILTWLLYSRKNTYKNSFQWCLNLYQYYTQTEPREPLG